MPFFKFRRGDVSPAPPTGAAAQAISVEVLRKRARHRLMGASVLVMLGVVGFPLLFETQPRPVAIDIPIEIPARDAAGPLALPAPALAAAPEPAAPRAAVPETVTAAASLSAREEIYPIRPSAAPVAAAAPAALVAPAAPVARPTPKPEPVAQAKPEAQAKPKPELKAEPKPPAKPVPAPVSAPAVADPRPPARSAAAADDGARAIALLNGAPAAPKVAALAKPPMPTEQAKAAAAETRGRMVVQVGAFADAGKAEETRRRLERAGLATYTQVADTKDGKRVRVRVGPFASKAEAEKAVNKIRSLDLPVAILSF